MTGSDFPLVSVILPIRNEAQYIGQALEALAAQEYPLAQMEVFVVDGMSTDGTAEAAAAFGQAHGARFARFELLENPHKIVPCGMNLATPHSRGDIIVRVDGHCVIAADYVARCVHYLETDQADGVGGSTETIGETYLARAIALAMSSRFGVGDSAFRTLREQTRPVDTVPFPAYKRSVVLHAGGYDEELVRNQDDEYNYRLRALGYRILLAADIRSRYYSRASLAKLWKQYFQYGFWKVRVLQKHPRQMRPRQFVPPLFAAALLGTALLTPLWAPTFTIVAAPYLLSNLAAAVLTARRHGWRYLPLLPVVYGTLHLSYGFGFLAGLVRFAGRWKDRTGKVPAMK